MIPILYDSITEGQVPSDFGLGVLTDTLKATVTEQRNGSYEMTLEYASSGIHAEDIIPNRIIKAKPNYTDDPQLFRIYKVGKEMNGRFEVNCQHISYDLSGKVITDGSASSCVQACLLLQNKAGNFTITTDKSVSAAFDITEPSSVRSWFGGKSGSLLDVYGTAEWKYDNFHCSLLAQRGTDRGVQIRYGKNLTQLSQEIDMSNLVTAIYPYYIDQNGNKTVGAKVQTGLILNIQREIAVDFSQDVDPDSSVSILSQLNTLANKYKANNNLLAPMDNIKLDFVQLQGLQERVDLCDTVHIFFDALGISAATKCISTTWDVLEERYTSTTFGDARNSIADTIAKNTKELESTPSVSFMNQAVTRATELITGNLGGYVINGHDSNGDGYPDENLIMNTPDINTATKVIRSNLGGIGFSQNGYSGPFTTAINYEGIVADAITTGTLNADLIKAGTISDAQGNSSINMTSGQAVMRSFTAKGNFSIINDSNLKKMGMIFPYAQGGAIQLNDSSETGRANLFVSNNSGFLYLYNSSGTRTAAISGSSGTINCSNLLVNNNSDTTVINNFVGSSGQGELYIGDGSATTNIYIHGGSGNITCVSLTQTSSRKVKENIKPITDSEKILELNAVSFDYKNKSRGTDRRGFIAEDVAEILPNLVTLESENTPASIDYVSMIPYLQDIIKKQEIRIKALEDKCNGSN